MSHVTTAVTVLRVEEWTVFLLINNYQKISQSFFFYLNKGVVNSGRLNQISKGPSIPIHTQRRGSRKPDIQTPIVILNEIILLKPDTQGLSTRGIGGRGSTSTDHVPVLFFRGPRCLFQSMKDRGKRSYPGLTQENGRVEPHRIWSCRRKGFQLVSMILLVLWFYGFRSQ